MTATDYTYIVMVADRSGSMTGMKMEAEGAIKSFINDQRSMPGKLTINFFEFDDQFEEVEEEMLDLWMLQPRGMTAMLDAIGKSVTTVGERLSALPEDERPDKVVLMIVTDGQENSSKEWTLDRVKELITEQQDKYSWEVVFSGANLDVAKVGASIGSVNNMAFAASPEGVRDAYGALSRSVSAYRSGGTRMHVPSDADDDDA